MKSFLKIATLLSFFTFLVSCSTNEPIPVNENIKIAEIDAAVIEAYLSINVSNPSSNKEVVLERNGQIVMRFSANKSDTAITDTGLTENTLYKYKAKLTEKGKVIGESSEVSIRTMQPTSQEFTWQTFTFGEQSSSSLYDVAIINENNIWAVGEIYMKDSTGKPDPVPYNFAKWNGKDWTVERVYYSYQGQNYLAPLYSTFAFGTNNLWVGSNQPMHWNGVKWEEYDLSASVWNGWINKIWGTSSNDLYIVGSNGNIARYQNGTWKKIENNVSSELDFFDVFGKDDNSSIYFIAASNYNGSNQIIRLFNNKFENMPFNEISVLRSIWYAYSNKIYLAGTYFFVYENGKWEKLKELSNQTTTSVRGVGSNDIVVAGTKGIINHFNGVTWQSYLTQGEYSAVDIKGNTVVAVGSSSAGEAFITIGKRN